MNGQPRVAFHARPRRQVGHPFICLDVFRPAIRIAGVIEGVDADEDVGALQHLRPGQRQRKEDGVAGRHVGHRDAVAHLVERPRLGYSHVRRQRGSAERVEPNLHHQALLHTQRRRYPRRRIQLEFVPLAVIERDRVAGKAIAPSQRQAGGRIEAARQETNCFSANWQMCGPV